MSFSHVWWFNIEVKFKKLIRIIRSCGSNWWIALSVVAMVWKRICSNCCVYIWFIWTLKVEMSLPSARVSNYSIRALAREIAAHKLVIFSITIWFIWICSIIIIVIIISSLELIKQCLAVSKWACISDTRVTCSYFS